MRKHISFYGKACSLVVICLILNTGTTLAAGSFSAVVSKVFDGDSLVVLGGEKETEVRLWGIDTPEYDQPYAIEARRALENLLLGRTVSVIPKYRDDYQRLVAIIELKFTNANQYMVSQGFAWVHIYYCNEEICNTWNALEADARNRRIGLWKEDAPIPPWKWKRRKKRR